MSIRRLNWVESETISSTGPFAVELALAIREPDDANMENGPSGDT